MPPIVLASTFAQSSPGVHQGFEYARTDNPTRRALETCLASLEGGHYGLAFGSGCAAMTTLFLTLRPGDHVVSCDDVYGGTFRLLDKVMGPLGIETSWVDLSNPSALEAAIRPETKLLWIETPTNPMLKLVDLTIVTEIARRHGVLSCVDNTFATPVLQRPLDLGADVVVHSTTKYLNGHSDVVGGAIITRDEKLAEKLRFLQNSVGAIPSPFDCFMVLRGIKTLSARVQAAGERATKLANWLEGHAGVQKVIYPGLASHPQFELAARQMRAPLAMISVVVRGGLAGATRMLERTKIFTLAESLGGVESLIEHPASMTHGAVPPNQRAAIGIEDGLVRLSVGLEGFEDLRADLEQALSFT